MPENKPKWESYHTPVDKLTSEMDAEVKIEKLMDELIRTQRHIERLSNYINDLVDHEHSNGKMVKRIQHPGQESYYSLNFRVYKKE